MIHCLIIEDEPLAAELLEDYVRQVPFLKLHGICTSAVQALHVLQTSAIDLIFLDIHLPGLKGLDFLQTLQNPPHTIVTTAYDQYALQGYEHNVGDYLLKPIEFKRFLQAVNKLKALRTPAERRKLTITADKKTVIIAQEDIDFIESQKEYIHIHLGEKVHITKYPLHRIEEELDPSQFLRIHRSFIVALAKVKAFNGQEIELGGKTLPIGGNYREEVAARLREFLKM